MTVDKEQKIMKRIVFLIIIFIIFFLSTFLYFKYISGWLVFHVNSATRKGLHKSILSNEGYGNNY